MSNTHELPPEQVSSFISQVLKGKDPSIVGLKKILKKNAEMQNDYPLKSASLDDFQVDGSGKKMLSEDERQILELEKKVADLQVKLRQQNEKSVAAIQAAYAKGMKEGREAGREDGLATATGAYEKKVNLLQQRIEEMLLNLESSKKLMLHDTEHIVLRLCNEMVKKIVRYEVTHHNDMVLSVLKHAMSFVGHHEKMIVRVAKGDLELISNRKDFWGPVGERLKDISIEPDDTIEPGGCILETNSGMVDARLGVQFVELEDMVEQMWNDAHSALIAGVDREVDDE